MLLLVVKPSLLETRRFKKVINWLSDHEVMIASGTNTKELAAEISEIWLTGRQLTVVACGGDGTFNLVLNSIPDLAIPLAVVPMGTGNDFARYLGIKKPKQAISILNTSSPLNMDLGVIELQNYSKFRFAGIASCGFDAQVNERANGYRGPSGTFKYLIALAVELVNLRSRQLAIATDGGATSQRNLTLIAVGNTSSYGGGLKMCPTANAYDQWFEITYVEKVSRNLLIRVLPKVFWGGHIKHRQVSQSANRQIEISGEQFPIYADGEKVGYGPATITNQPGAMRVWQAQPTQTP